MVTYLATLFLGKPPRDSLPIVSAYSFAHILHKKYTDFPEERFVTSVTKQKM